MEKSRGFLSRSLFIRLILPTYLNEVSSISIFCRGLYRRFFRVKCGNEPIRGKARLPNESKLTTIIPNMVLETSKYTFLMISAMI